MLRLFAEVEMKVEITNVCRHGRCRFCSPLFRPTVAEAPTREFLSQFEHHLEVYLNGGGRKIILTGGGEPIDAPAKLFGVLRIISEKTRRLGIKLDLLTVYSNGVGLLDPNPEKTNLDKLFEYGLRDINLSVHGLSQKQRVGISGERMGNVDFETLIPTIVEKGIRVMTRSTLASGFLDSVKEIEEFTAWMSRLGVRIVYFSNLFEVPVRNEYTTPGSTEVLEWTDKHRIPFGRIVDEMKTSIDFEFVSESTRHNDQGKTFEFRHKSGIEVLLGSLEIGNESEETASYAYIKPDGSMYMHNNACSVRNLVSLAEIRKYRPGRDDIYD